MSEANQDTVENAGVDKQSNAEAGTLGFSNASSVAAIFPARAVELGDYNPETDYFALLNGTTEGHGFAGSVNLNFSANSPPDGTIAADVTVPPANAYVPNPTSPGGTIGVPNDNPTQKGAAPDSFVTMNGLGGATGGGPSMVDANGAPVTPSQTSAQISVSERRDYRHASGAKTRRTCGAN